MIDRFRGEFRFLSNFYPAIVSLDGVEYPTVEHAYQAAKCKVTSDRVLICLAPTAGTAKRMGRNVQIRQDWGEVKLNIMYDLLRQKFSTEPLRQKLLDTGDQELVEGNDWGDTFWGVCRGKGDNWLGVLLMSIRDEIRGAEK